MKNKYLSILLSVLLFTLSAKAQEDSPYRTSWKVDAPIIAAGVGLSFLGLSMIKNKKGLTEAEVNALTKDNVNSFDRAGAGKYSENADKLSYYPFYASFAMPVAMLLNKNEGKKAGQVLALYLETMAVTGTVYTLTAGSVRRSRPLVYSNNAPPEKRMEKGSQRSFFAGHTAATASATFFTAKVFSDFNPDSKAKPYVWAAAAVIPAVVGYYRYQGGRHFITDNIVGYAVGAGVGILVPQLHKKSNKADLTVTPIVSPEYKGTSLVYTF